MEQAQFSGLTIGDAQELMKEHVPGIRHGWREAWNHFEAYARLCTWPVSRRVRANIINEYMTKYMDRYLATRTGVNRIYRYGSLIGDFGGKALVRFKKLDKNGKSRNVPTIEQHLFSFQRFQTYLPGSLPEATVLISGYELDGLEKGILRLVITCPLGGVNLWSFDIGLDEPKIDSVKESVDVVEPRVRIRKGAQRKRKEMEKAE